MAKSVLIIGAGRFGRYSAQKLHEMGHDVMVVDQREDLINQIMPFVSDARIGDSTDKAFMNTLGVNLSKKIISRATSHRQEKFLLRNGASYVVFPERELGYWTAIRFSSDGISNYVDLSDGYGVYEIKVPDRWSGKRIDELDVRRKYHINILGVRDPCSTRVISPNADGTSQALPEIDMDIRNNTVLHSGQTMMVLGKSEYIQKIL